MWPIPTVPVLPSAHDGQWLMYVAGTPTDGLVQVVPAA